MLLRRRLLLLPGWCRRRAALVVVVQLLAALGGQAARVMVQLLAGPVRCLPVLLLGMQHDGRGWHVARPRLHTRCLLVPGQLRRRWRVGRCGARF